MKIGKFLSSVPRSEGIYLAPRSQKTIHIFIIFVGIEKKNIKYIHYTPIHTTGPNFFEKRPPIN